MFKNRDLIDRSRSSLAQTIEENEDKIRERGFGIHVLAWDQAQEGSTQCKHVPPMSRTRNYASVSIFILFRLVNISKGKRLLVHFLPLSSHSARAEQRASNEKNFRAYSNEEKKKEKKKKEKQKLE